MLLVTSQNIWDQTLLLAFTEFISIYTKLSLVYLLPVKPCFICMEQIQIYTNINQNKTLAQTLHTNKEGQVLSTVGSFN